MNPIKATDLLHLVQKNVDHSKPVKPQLLQLFIPAFWNNNVVLRNSWQGKIAHFFQYPSELKTQEDKITRIFAQAVDQAAWDGANFRLGIKLKQEFGSKKSATLSPALKDSPELEALAKSKELSQQAVTAKPKSKKSLSSLLQACSQKNPIDISAFRTLFEADFQKDPLKALEYIEKYLKQNPKLGREGWQEKLALLRHSFKQDQDLNALFAKADEKPAMLKAAGKALCQLVQQLNDKQKTLIQFSFGSKNINLPLLLNMFKQLPKSALETLPEQLKALLKSDTLADPQKAADALIHRFFECIPQSSVNLHADKLTPLFENSERQLPDYVAAVLPKLFEIYLEHPLRKGVLGTAALCVSDPTLQSALEWISHHGQTFLEKGQPFILQTMEEKLKELLHSQFDSVSSQYLGETIQLFQDARHLLSPQAMEMLGLDKGLICGPVWMEIEKSGDSKFNLSVYALGNALNYHADNPKTGKKYSVLRLTGIHEDKLNDAFFYSLLKKHLDPESVCKASDIYLGPLATLEASVAPNPADDLSDVDKKPATSLELSQCLLLKPQACVDMRWDALIHICKSYLKGETLDIPNPQDRQFLIKVLKEIEGSAAEDKKELIEALQLALQNPLPSSSVPGFSLQNPIQGFFNPLGFTPQKLKEYQGVIRWALGDDVANVVDRLADQTAAALPEAVKAHTVVEHKKEVLQEFYSMLYLDTAMQAMGYAAALAGLWSLDIWQFLNLSVLIGALPSLIPQWVFDWCQRVFQALQRKFGEMAFLAALYIFTSKETREELQAKVLAWKQTLQQKALELLDGKKISYAIGSIIPVQHPPEVKLVTTPHTSLTKPITVLYPRANFEDRELASTIDKDIWHPFSYSPLQSRNEPLTNPSLKEIESWQHCQNMQPGIRLQYLCHQINRLEVPSHSHKTCWDRVETPEAYLEILSCFSLSMSNDSFTAQAVIPAYKLLAIMDCLARRCPNTHLEGNRINAYPLLKWVQNRHNSLRDPFYLDELKAIAAYLLPDIDLENIPSPEDIDKRAKETLFNYQYTDDFFSRFTMDHLSSFKWDLLMSKKEQEHFEKLATNPPFAAKLKELEKQLTYPEEAKEIMMDNAFYFFDPSISSPITRLRLQNILCNALANNKDIECWKAKETIKQYMRVPIQVYKNMSNPERTAQKYAAFKTLVGGYLACSYKTKTDPPDYQSKHMGPSEFDYMLLDYKPSERIPLVLDYISKNPNCIHLLYHIFRQPGELKRQIEQSPQIISTLAELIDRAIEINKDKPFRTLELLRERLQVQLYCDKVLPGSGKEFPDTSKVFDRLEHLCKSPQEKYHLLLLKLAMLQMGHPLSQLSFEERKKGILLIFELLMLPISSDGHFMKYWEWIPIIDEIMNDGEAREGILDALFPKIAHEHTFQPGFRWTRMGKLHFQKGNINLNIPLEYTKGIKRKYFDLETIKDHSYVYAVLGREISKLNYSGEENVYTAPGYKVTIQPCPNSSDVEIIIHKYVLDPKQSIVKKFRPYIRKSPHDLQPHDRETALNMSSHSFIGRFYPDESMQQELKDHQRDPLLVIKKILLITQTLKDQTNELKKYGSLVHFQHIMPENNSVISQISSSWFFSPDFEVVLKYDERDKRYQVEVHSRTTITVNCYVSEHILWVEDTQETDKPLQSPTEQQQPQPPEIQVNASLYQEGFEGLSRFCPIEKIKGYAKEGATHLSKFTLGGSLNFKVTPNQDGVLEAECEQYPGFYMAEKQTHPALAEVSSYLLLEDRNGKKMVLVPKSQWMQATASRLTKLAGPLARIAMDALAKAAQSFNFSKPDDTYCFEIQSNESTLLTSSDPEALTYLMVLYYFQGKREALEKTLEPFEWACNIKPLFNSVWMQLLPIMLIPMDFEGVVPLRRRMLAAVAQNQHIIDRETNQDEKSGVLDLILGIAILRELDNYQKEKNPRQRLSIHQEFFLYESAFEKLGAFVATRTHSLVKQGMDQVGFELLIELTGLSKTLAKRYGEIRREVGLNGSSRLATVLRLGGEFNAAASSIPEVLIEANGTSTHRQASEHEAFFSKLARVFVSCRNSLIHNMEELKLDELFEQMDRTLVNPVLDPIEMTPEMIKKHFPTYYALARFTRHSSDAKRLAYALKILKGSGDSQSQILMAYLEAVLASPDDFPPVKELFSSREKQGKNYPYALTLNTSLYKDYPKWFEFFNALNNIAFGETLGKETVEPAYHNFLIRSGVYRALGIAASHILPTGLPALVQMSVDMGASAALTGLAERGIKALRSLKSALPSPASLAGNLTKSYHDILNAPWKKIAWLGLKTLGPLGMLYLSRYAYYTAPHEIKPCMPEDEPQPYINHLMYQGLTMVGAAFIRFAFSKAMKTSYTLTDAVGPYLSSSLHKASKLINGVKAQVKKTGLLDPLELPKKQNPLTKVDYSILEAQDQAINTILNKQFALVFDELPAEWEDPALSIPVKPGSALLQRNYKKVNTSLKAYREDPNSRPTTFRVHNEKGLLTVYDNLLQLKTALMQQVEKERQSLLKLFNTSVDPAQANPTPLTLNAVHALIDKGEVGEIGKAAGLTQKDLPKIEIAAVRIDHKTSRLHQIQRLIALMDTLPDDRTSNAYAERLEQLAIELKTTTAFSFKTIPSRLLRIFLRFQAESKKMLWSKQAETRRRVLIDEEGNIVTEEIPGSGKTDVGIPLTAEYLCDGTHIVCPIFPRTLAADNIREIHRQMWLLGKRSHVLQSKRDMLLTIKKLDCVLVLLYGSMLEREPIPMTKEDAQAFQSILIDHAHHYRHTPGANTYEAQQCLIRLKGILRVFRHLGIDIPDEAHETYSQRKQLNYPIGSPQKIAKDLYMVSEACMRLIMRDSDLALLIKENKLTSLDKKYYKSTIRPRLARLISKHIRFNITDETKRAEFSAFVCDKGTSVPKWITDDSQLYREASMVKGILTDLFPRNFKNRTNVNFGASKEGNGEFARPSDGNTHVLETDSIRLAYEGLIKTFLMLESDHLNPEQGEKLYKKLKDSALRQMKQYNIDYTDTLLYKAFGEIFPTIDTQPAGAMDKLCAHPEASLLYMRHFIRKEILYWKYNIQSTSHDFDGVFGKHYSGTGTPNNQDTFPAGKKVINDPTTLGEAVEILSTKCPKDGIHILQKTTPAEIIKEILKTNFMPGYTFSALIDGAAYATGMENIEVATMMAEFCKKHRPDIKAIKYYKKGENGQDQVELLWIGKQDGELKPEQCLSYFDQMHGFGANIPQKGDGFCTIGPDHLLFKLIQEVFRIRGLKKKERLKAIEELLVKIPMQKIHLAMTQDVLKMIMDRDPQHPAPRPLTMPTLNDIIDFALRNETALSKEENYPSMLLKYHTAPRQAAYDKIMDIPDEDFERWMAVYDEFEDLYVTESVDDPTRLWGGLTKKEPTPDALISAADHAISKIAKSPTFTSEEKKDFKKMVKGMPIPPMQEKVPVWKHDTAALSSLGQNETVVQTAQQKTEADAAKETDNDQEQDQDQDTERQTHVQNQWQRKTPAYQESDLIKTPVYKVQQLLTEADDKNLQAVASMFDPRLCMSNNFVHNRKNTLMETAVQIGSREQMYLYSVLVQAQAEKGRLKILQASPITINEQAQWREKLHKVDWDQQDIKTMIWSPSAAYVIAGYQYDRDKLRKNEDLKTLIGQLKFLNGDVRYPQAKKEMTSWLKKYDAAKLNEAYDAIHGKRGKEPVHSKDIDHIFMDARADEIFYHERL